MTPAEKLGEGARQETRCGTCLGALNVTGDGSVAEPGDLWLCPGCGELTQRDDRLALRLVELESLPPEERAHVRAQRLQIAKLITVCA